MKTPAEITHTQNVTEHVPPRRICLTPKLLSMAHTDHMIVKITGPMVEEPMPGLARNETGTVPLLPCTELGKTEPCMLIVPAVLGSVLKRVPEYVGKVFELKNGDVVPGKNYRQMDIWELEL